MWQRRFARAASIVFSFERRTSERMTSAMLVTVQLDALFDTANIAL
jgi:hypothetical protein